LRYFDNPDLSKVTTKVENGKLVIDTRPLTNDRHCNGICIPALTDVKVIVEAPTSVPMDMPDMPLPAKPQPPQPLKTF
jgi:hypothetical protein